MSDRSKNVLAFVALVGIAAIASARNLPVPAAGPVQTAAVSAPSSPVTQVSLIR